MDMKKTWTVDELKKGYAHFSPPYKLFENSYLKGTADQQAAWKPKYVAQQAAGRAQFLKAACDAFGIPHDEHAKYAWGLAYRMCYGKDHEVISEFERLVPLLRPRKEKQGSLF